MTDTRAQGPASAPHEPGADVPPPSPWWSRPSEQWDAPREPDSGSSEQPPYGGYLSPPPVDDPRPDPWSTPTTRATFPSGASTWGGATDTIGGPPPASRRSRRGLGTAALVLATGLLAGVTGGVVGARYDEDRGLLDPSASLGSGSSTSASLSRDPESVAGVAARVMRSTVSIAVRGSAGSGTGSGVVIRSDGYIVTNNHVVASAAGGGRITVTLDDGEQELPARIVGRDPVTDLAVLQVQTSASLPAATLGSSGSLVAGDSVIAIGSPLGLSGTVTTGIISALNRTVRVPSEDGVSRPLLNAIQTDAAINPGNSGGALVNAEGEVIGINSAIATLGGGGPFGGEQGGSIGVGFAIPVDEARSVAEEIIRTGKATHPSIGVSATTVSESGREGALVRELTTGGAAERAGLQPNDLITEVDDEKVSSVDELVLNLRKHRVGEEVTLTYERGGRTRTIDVTLQDRRD